MLSSRVLERGGCAEALFKMALGNRIGVCVSDEIDENAFFEPCAGAFVLELKEGTEIPAMRDISEPPTETMQLRRV